MLARLLAVAFAVALAIPPTSASRAAAQSDSAEAARDRWQRVPELLQAMDVREGSVVADVGAGAGFLTMRLAAAVGGSGRVYAVDIVPDILKRLRERLSKEGLNNVVVVEGTEADPRLPGATLDAIVMVNAFHEVDDAPTVLQAFRVALKQGGRLVLCEPGPKSPAASRAAQVKISRAPPATD